MGSDSYNFPMFETSNEINKMHTSTTPPKNIASTQKESGITQLTVRICHGISLNSEQDVAMEIFPNLKFLLTKSIFLVILFYVFRTFFLIVCLILIGLS